LIALFVGRAIPSWMGRPLTHNLALYLSSHKDWEIVRAVRLNQWVASGMQLSGDKLNQAVRDTFHYTARSLYDFYHYLDVHPQKQKILVFNQQIQRLIDMSNNLGRGAVVAGIHMSNFDFALQIACRRGFKPLVLGLPEFKGGYQWQHEMRLKSGVDVIPISLSSMRKAVDHLQRGGLVATGIDRPIPQLDNGVSPKFTPKFFGLPSHTPVHHIIIALKAKVPIYVAAVSQKEDQTYHFQVSEPQEMDYCQDHQTAIHVNAENILSVAEEFIKISPRQWGMSYPVWPAMAGACP